MVVLFSTTRWQRILSLCVNEFVTQVTLMPLKLLIKILLTFWPMVWHLLINSCLTFFCHQIKHNYDWVSIVISAILTELSPLSNNNVHRKFEMLICRFLHIRFRYGVFRYMSKRQQPHWDENVSPRPPIGLQWMQRKPSYQRPGCSWPQNIIIHIRHFSVLILVKML